MLNEAMRERLFNMRVSDEEGARLDAVANHYGLNAAGVIRMLLKREADAIGFVYSPPAKRKPAPKRAAKRAKPS